MYEIIFIILGISAVAVFYFGRNRPFEPPETTPSTEKTYRQFERVPSLFVNRAEVTFFHTLNKALPAGYFLMSKVRLEDVIGVKASVRDAEARWKLRARVKSRHVDYVITDRAGVPLAGIELDGASHGEDSFEADTLKNGLFRTVGLPLFRVPVGTSYFEVCDKIVSTLPTPES